MTPPPPPHPPPPHKIMVHINLWFGSGIFRPPRAMLNWVVPHYTGCVTRTWRAFKINFEHRQTPLTNPIYKCNAARRLSQYGDWLSDWRDRSSNPGQRRLSPLQTCLYRLWGPSVLHLNDCRASFPVLRRPERDLDLWSPSSTEI